jgi:Flp pilus assembly protein TadD
MNFKRGLSTLVCTFFIGFLLLSPSTRASAQTGQQKAQASQTIAQPGEEKFERGKRLYQQGDIQGALPLLRDATQSRKKDSAAWLYYGLALSNAGNAKDARKAFEKAIKLQPNDAGAHTGLAYSLLQLNKPRDAEREARRALALDPERAEAHYVIGMLRYSESKFAEAAEQAGTAARLKPDAPAIASLYGHTLLGVYLSESERLAERYPFPPNADEATRQPVFAQRDAALEPIRSRMREAADRIEAFAQSQPNNPAAEEWRDFAETLRVYGQTSKEGQRPLVFRQAQVMKKALITFKPEPGFTEEARKHNVTGVVRLRAVLAADGRVRHLIVIKGLPYGLTEKASAAAVRIRFTPATINGQPVSQFIVLEYNFNVY